VCVAGKTEPRQRRKKVFLLRSKGTIEKQDVAKLKKSVKGEKGGKGEIKPNKANKKQNNLYKKERINRNTSSTRIALPYFLFNWVFRPHHWNRGTQRKLTKVHEEKRTFRNQLEGLWSPASQRGWD